MKSRYVSLRKNPAGSPENKKISYPGKGTRFGKHLFLRVSKSNIHCVTGQDDKSRYNEHCQIMSISFFSIFYRVICP